MHRWGKCYIAHSWRRIRCCCQHEYVEHYNPLHDGNVTRVYWGVLVLVWDGGLSERKGRRGNIPRRNLLAFRWWAMARQQRQEGRYLRTTHLNQHSKYVPQLKAVVLANPKRRNHRPQYGCPAMFQSVLRAYICVETFFGATPQPGGTFVQIQCTPAKRRLATLFTVQVQKELSPRTIR